MIMKAVCNGSLLTVGKISAQVGSNSGLPGQYASA